MADGRGGGELRDDFSRRRRAQVELERGVFHQPGQPEVGHELQPAGSLQHLGRTGVEGRRVGAERRGRGRKKHVRVDSPCPEGGQQVRSCVEVQRGFNGRHLQSGDAVRGGHVLLARAEAEQDRRIAQPGDVAADEQVGEVGLHPGIGELDAEQLAVQHAFEVALFQDVARVGRGLAVAEPDLREQAARIERPELAEVHEVELEDRGERRQEELRAADFLLDLQRVADRTQPGEDLGRLLRRRLDAAERGHGVGDELRQRELRIRQEPAIGLERVVVGLAADLHSVGEDAVIGTHAEELLDVRVEEVPVRREHQRAGAGQGQRAERQPPLELGAPLPGVRVDRRDAVDEEVGDDIAVRVVQREGAVERQFRDGERRQDAGAEDRQQRQLHEIPDRDVHLHPDPEAALVQRDLACERRLADGQAEDHRLNLGADQKLRVELGQQLLDQHVRGAVGGVLKHLAERQHRPLAIAGEQIRHRLRERDVQGSQVAEVLDALALQHLPGGVEHLADQRGRQLQTLRQFRVGRAVIDECLRARQQCDDAVEEEGPQLGGREVNGRGAFGGGQRAVAVRVENQLRERPIEVLAQPGHDQVQAVLEERVGQRRSAVRDCIDEGPNGSQIRRDDAIERGERPGRRLRREQEAERVRRVRHLDQAGQHRLQNTVEVGQQLHAGERHAEDPQVADGEELQPAGGSGELGAEVGPDGQVAADHAGRVRSDDRPLEGDRDRLAPSVLAVLESRECRLDDGVRDGRSRRGEVGDVLGLRGHDDRGDAEGQAAGRPGQERDAERVQGDAERDAQGGHQRAAAGDDHVDPRAQPLVVELADEAAKVDRRLGGGPGAGHYRAEREQAANPHRADVERQHPEADAAQVLNGEFALREFLDAEPHVLDRRH